MTTGTTDKKVLVWQIFITLFSLALWEYFARVSQRIFFFFSCPTSITERMWQWSGQHQLWVDLGATLTETAAGFILGALVAIILAFISYSSPTVDKIMQPFLTLANAMPRLVLGPIFILWFGLGLSSKIMLGFSLVVFIVYFATYQSLKEVDPALILRVRLMGGTDKDILRHVLLPSVMTWVFNSLKSSMGFSLVGAIVGEYMGASYGIGYRISYCEGMFDSTGVFAGLGVLVIMVFCLDRALEGLESMFKPSKAQSTSPKGIMLWSKKAAAGLCSVILAAVIIHFAFCSGNDQKVQGDKVTLGSAGITLMGNLPSIVAEEKGYYANEGVDLEILDFKGGAAAAKALIGGSADFASIALEHVIKANAQGGNLVYLFAYDRYPGLSLIVSENLKDKVRSINDLKGLTVGITSMGSGSHMGLESLLIKNNISVNAVKIVSAGTNTMPGAMEKGAIDAAMHYDPFVTDLILRDKAYSLFELNNKENTHWLYGSDYPYLGLATRRDIIQKSPHVVQKMVSATLKAQIYTLNNTPETVAAVLPKDFNASNPTYVKALKHSMPTFSPTGLVNEEEVATVLKSLKLAKVVPQNSNLKADTVLDMSFVKKASQK